MVSGAIATVHKEPQYFLVQVSEQGSKNVLNNNKYWYGGLNIEKKDSAFNDVMPDDILLVYFAGGAIDYQMQLRMIYKVKHKSNDNKELLLEKFRELRPVSLSEIRSKIVTGELSQRFSNCGRQGFNICKITASDYEMILAISEKLPPTPPTIGSEGLVEDFMVNNWKPGEWFGKDFEDIEIFRDEENNVIGQQYDTKEIGIIDLLCKDKKSGDYTVIEIKRSNQTRDDVAGQIGRYVSWVREHMAKGKRVRGIILCGGHDKKLDYAVKNQKDCFIAHYDVRFSIKMEKL